jgi:hypothetical protein
VTISAGLGATAAVSVGLGFLVGGGCAVIAGVVAEST